MALFQTGDGYGSPEITFTMRLNGDIWAKRALIEALYLLTQSFNWVSQGSATPEQAALTFSEAIGTIRFGTYMVGSLVPYVSQNPPFGTIPCDGGTYLRTDYPALYAALDPQYIVDPDTFTTPIITGRAVIGAGVAAWGVGYDVGDIGGEHEHALTEAELASHAHAYDPVIVGDLDVEGAGVPQPNAAQIVPAITENTYDAGGDQPHNNMQPYLALNWAIVAL